MVNYVGIKRQITVTPRFIPHNLHCNLYHSGLIQQIGDIFLFFPDNMIWHFHWRQFAWFVKSQFLGKMRIASVSSAENFTQSAKRVKKFCIMLLSERETGRCHPLCTSFLQTLLRALCGLFLVYLNIRASCLTQICSSWLVTACGFAIFFFFFFLQVM